MLCDKKEGIMLNSIDDAAQEQLVFENVSEELQKAWSCAKRLKGKTIKPEKLKKKKNCNLPTTQIYKIKRFVE